MLSDRVSGETVQGIRYDSHSGYLVILFNSKRELWLASGWDGYNILLREQEVSDGLGAEVTR